MRATWYVLEDGSVVDPAEVAHDESGQLVHKNGGRVAMRGQTPSSRSVDVESASRVPSTRTPTKPKSKDMKSDDQKPGYITRETKAD